MGNPRSKKSSTAPWLLLRTDQVTSLVFFSFLVEFHRDRGIEWRGILYPAYLVLLQSPSTHIPCILQRFWHTLLYVRVYSSRKRNIVIPEMMSVASQFKNVSISSKKTPMRLVNHVISCDGLGGSIACAWNSQLSSSLSQICVTCSTMKMSCFY